MLAWEEWIIQLKADETFSMRRFTLFHEAFHILAHCGGTPVFRKGGAIRSSFNELLTDYFATCLLMPRQWMRETWAEVKDLDRMAEIFDAPKAAVCVRLRQLGLV
jgi:Zn-dependent peptidase ImmA (M78 family)